MNKEEFLAELKDGLSGLPADDVEERLSFYGEMIDDRVEEGCTEAEAVAGIGSIESIVSQIIADTPLTRLVKEKIKPERKPGAGSTALIVLGFPLWFPLIITAGAIVLSLYIVVWSLIISLWAVGVSLAAGLIGGIAVAVAYFFQGCELSAVFIFGASLICAGLAILMGFGCIAATKGVVILTKRAMLGVKTRFLRKENAK